MKLRNLLDPLYNTIEEGTENNIKAYYITSKVHDRPQKELLIDKLNSFFFEHTFIQTTIELRTLQKRYYKGEKNLLGDCKRLEKQLDEIIENMIKYNQK